jgi:5-methylcytosine-specific restriction endonuclease McrA
MEYSEKLKHPKWQKKRLEILQRDNFTCRCCKEKDKPLNVHHVVYNKNCEIWEYNNIDLITLCDECHKTWHTLYDNKNLYPEIIGAVSYLYNYIDKLRTDYYFNKD